MHYVSLIVECLRGRPSVAFWIAALGQGVLWFAVPALFYSAPPEGLADLLITGWQFRLGNEVGPPLAFWLAQLAFRTAGIVGVYLLAQVCVVVALWAVFKLGSAIVGARHAALAVLLMTGLTVLTVPSVDFGPAVLALPLWALSLLHYWRAAGEGRRGYWMLLAIELGLLLITSIVGVVLLVLLVIATLLQPRARAAFRHAEPWLAIVFLLFVIAPYAGWLAYHPELAQPIFAPVRRIAAPGSAALWALALIVVAHLGLAVLVALTGGWPRGRHERPPVIDGRAADPAGRFFVYGFALVPLLAAVAFAAAGGAVSPQQLAPLVLLSGLAVVVLAGAPIKLYRERIVSFVWLALLVVPPVLAVLTLAVSPWLAIETPTAQPANAMGRFFSDSFQRRTGQPLRHVTGDQRIATLAALASPDRPAVLLLNAPERTPWTTPAQFRASGGVVVWPATDTAGAPPPAIKAAFPDLVAEVPRIFERPVQGQLPLLRIGWGVVRPASPQPGQ
jgi:4-amino-4-deoxy-L-arabinose transferase-like glycosyltransferase